MRLRDWILLGLLFVWFASAAIVWLKGKKEGSCKGCGGCEKSSCASCREKDKLMH